MWTLLGRTNDGSIEEIRLRRIDGYPSRREILDAAHEHLTDLPGGRCLETMRRDLQQEGVLLGIDAIPNWGEAAADLFRSAAESTGRRDPRGLSDNIRFSRNRGLSSLVYNSFDGRQVSTWHEPQAIIADLTGLNELLIEGVPKSRASSDIRSYCQWRAYVGSNTRSIDGETLLKRPGGGTDRGQRRGWLTLPRAIGAIVGLFANVVGRVTKSPPCDPTFLPRLSYYRRKHPQVVGQFPDVSSLPSTLPSNLNRLVVFIHGTASCAIPHVNAIGGTRSPMFRFEHDTFLSLADNAERLHGFLQNLPASTKIDLVAHSRGGLVARLLAQRRGFPNSMRILTYGAPHLGTPLANAGGKALRALMAAGQAAAGLAASDHATAAFKMLVRPRDLPVGLDVMRTASDCLRMLNIGPGHPSLTSYGGVYDEQRLPPAVSSASSGGFGEHAFGGEENDLVVPLRSATGAGHGKRVAGSCHHSQYFDVEGLVDEIRRL